MYTLHYTMIVISVTVSSSNIDTGVPSTRTTETLRTPTTSMLPTSRTNLRPRRQRWISVEGYRQQPTWQLSTSNDQGHSPPRPTCSSTISVNPIDSIKSPTIIINSSSRSSSSISTACTNCRFQTLSPLCIIRGRQHRRLCSSKLSSWHRDWPTCSARQLGQTRCCSHHRRRRPSYLIKATMPSVEFPRRRSDWYLQSPLLPLPPQQRQPSEAAGAYRWFRHHRHPVWPGSRQLVLDSTERQVARRSAIIRTTIDCRCDLIGNSEIGVFWSQRFWLNFALPIIVTPTCVQVNSTLLCLSCRLLIDKKQMITTSILHRVHIYICQWLSLSITQQHPRSVLYRL